jgi:hypothetical protein
VSYTQDTHFPVPLPASSARSGMSAQASRWSEKPAKPPTPSSTSDGGGQTHAVPAHLRPHSAHACVYGFMV